LQTKEQILDKIIELDGDCLDAKLCKHCPFAPICLPDFLVDRKRPTKSERVQLALDELARNSLMGDVW
jgi:hypothetical protein